MDIEVHRKLCQLIEEITTSGSSSLDEAKCKAIKKICKKSDVYVKAAFTLLMDQIEREHAQIRLSCLLLVDQLFCRSHSFRLLMVTDLHKIMGCCMGTDASMPLPRPKDVAESMRRQAIQCFSDWHQKFGEHYKKLALGYSHLQRTKKVDFANLEARSNQERRQAEAEAQRKQIVLRRKLDTVKQQMNEMIADMGRCITEMESCFQLLLPSVDAFEPVVGTRAARTATTRTAVTRSDSRPCESSRSPVDGPACAAGVGSRACSLASARDRRHSTSRTVSFDSEVPDAAAVEDRGARMSRTVSTSSADVDNFEEWDGDGGECESGYSEDDDGHTSLQSQGMPSGYSLTLDARSLTMAGAGGYCVTENADNSDLLTALADNRRLVLRKFLPATAAWLSVLTKNADEEGERLRHVIDCRQQMMAGVDKFSELKVEWRDRSGPSAQAEDCGSSDDEDVEFEDVPEKEGLEPFAVEDVELDQALQASRRSARASATRRTARALSGAASSASSAVGTAAPLSSSSWSLTGACGEQPAVDPTSIAAQLTTVPRERSKGSRAASAAASATSSSFGSTTRAAAAAGSSSSSLGLGYDDDGVVSSEADVSSTSGLLAVAPKIRFDNDILNWGAESDTPPEILKLDSLHRFWNNADEPEFVNKEVWQSANQRSMSFTGKFEPVKWACRAPLSSGKLCLRRDRVKCPFHGIVVARDKQGRPNSVEEGDTEQCSQEGRPSGALPASLCAAGVSEQAAPRAAWQDLEADVAAAVGLPDLQSKSSRRKRKAAAAKEATSLVNLDAADNTPKSRIAKRIFSKGSVNRVGASLDAISSKRGDDRFGNQWNYSFGS